MYNKAEQICRDFDDYFKKVVDELKRCEPGTLEEYHKNEALRNKTSMLVRELDIINGFIVYHSENSKKYMYMIEMLNKFKQPPKR